MRVEVGQKILLSEDLSVRCCWRTIPAGDTITIRRRTSNQPLKRGPKTVYILDSDGTSVHGVRTSKIKGEVVQ